MLTKNENRPGGVPQHMLRSSMCSTSSPINQAPSDTSSLAYLCSIGLKANDESTELESISIILNFVNNRALILLYLTDLLKYMWPNLLKWHKSVQLHDGNTCFLLLQISSIQAHGTSRSWNHANGLNQA